MDFFLSTLKQSQEEQEKVCLIDRAAWLLSILSKGSSAAAKAFLMCQRDPALLCSLCLSGRAHMSSHMKLSLPYAVA